MGADPDFPRFPSVLTGTQAQGCIPSRNALVSWVPGRDAKLPVRYQPAWRTLQILWGWGGGIPVLPDPIWATHCSQHGSDRPRNRKDHYSLYIYWFAHFPPSSSTLWPLNPLGCWVFPLSHCHKGDQMQWWLCRNDSFRGRSNSPFFYPVSWGRKRMEQQNVHSHKQNPHHNHS